MEMIGAISGLLAAVVIPVVILVVGQAYTKAIRDREIKGRLVEIAIGILTQPNAENEELMKWARDVVDSYSGIPLPEKVRFPALPPFPEDTASGSRALARRLKEAERFEEAAQAYLNAFDLDPKDPAPLNFAGVIYGKDIGDFFKAEEMYARALSVDPHYVSPIYNRACNEVRLKNFNAALDYLQDAISKDPKYRQLAQRDQVFAGIEGDEERQRFKELLQIG